MIKKPKGTAVWRGGAIRAYYEAGRKGMYYKQRTETGDGDAAVLRAGKSLREQARHLDQNHDLSRGILNILVQNTVGPNGITVEPQPRNFDGTINKEAAKLIRTRYERWAKRPEVTYQHDLPSAQRLKARTLFRDGEVLHQHLIGRIPQHEHSTETPYSFEMIEADLLPLDMNDTGRRITSGIERSRWGRPLRFHLYETHPGSQAAGMLSNTRPVDASRILHAKLIDRIGQARGVSMFASIMLRLDDIKDYETSERIAAKVAASMAAYIKKGLPDQYHPDSAELDDNGDVVPRDIRFKAGMVFDDLRPGEDIGTIDTNRPNTNMHDHRNGQLRAVASGSNVSYSSAAKDYSGTYSSQRQELVEQWGAYQILASEFINQDARPTYETYLRADLQGGGLVLPNLDPNTIFDALYIPPSMPWIDPKKEIEADLMAEQAVYDSAQSIIRRRGRNPDDVLEQEAAWREQLEQRGIDSTGTEGPDTGTDSEDFSNVENIRN